MQQKYSPIFTVLTQYSWHWTIHGIRTIKKTPSLITQVNLLYQNRMYVTACNKVLPYFHSEKLKITEMDTSTAF